MLDSLHTYKNLKPLVGFEIIRGKRLEDNGLYKFVTDGTLNTTTTAVATTTTTTKATITVIFCFN
jgi:hypothetical protein